MEVDLAPEIEAVLRAKVAAGEYPSLASLVEEALFLLVERDWQAAQRDLRTQVPGLLGAPAAAAAAAAADTDAPGARTTPC